MRKVILAIAISFSMLMPVSEASAKDLWKNVKAFMSKSGHKKSITMSQYKARLKRH